MKKKIKKIIKKQLTGITLIFAVIFLIVGLVSGFLVYSLTNKEGETKIELIGNNICDINLGEEYQEEGYKFIINGEDYSSDVKITNNVNNSEVGTYVITYTLKTGEHDIVLTRIINVLGGVSNG